MDISQQKKQIRKAIKARKSLLTDEDKLLASENVYTKLISDDRFNQCKIIVAYWSLDDEVPTHEIVEKLSKDRPVYLPVIVGESLEFRRFTGRENMHTESSFGIGEPTSEETLADNADEVAILVPGVAFTAKGERLGRGRGFYDRVFQKQPKAYKIGIAFTCQILETLPTEPHDVLMDTVVWG